MDNNSRKMRTLITQLNSHTTLYDAGTPIISDKEWDDLYFELERLEKETGVVYPDSPTHKIQFEKISELPKVAHEYKPMLSLPKTKDPKAIEDFCFAHKEYWDWFAMFKMDGLSCRLTYINGELVKGETRGDGEVGEDVTGNIKVVKNIPLKINTEEPKLLIDGEIICNYKDFEKFKDSYKNARNFAAGSIRLLDAKESAARNLSFVAWDLIKGYEDIDYNFRRLEILDDLGFETVPRVGDAESVSDAIDALDRMDEHKLYPIDGYVFKFESKAFCEKLGRVEHHFNSAIAFKFYDEEYETELLNIELSMGRTGVLTPIAVFKPVDIDGSTVERASLHNLSVLEDTLGEYPELLQDIWVTKVNQIIPQIVRANKNNIPHDHVIFSQQFNHCPCCCWPAVIKTSESGVKNLVCANPNCEGKLANRIDHFFGKKGLDVKGISKATIGKLIDWGWVNKIEDVYGLDEYKTEWISKEGFGTASVEKILNAIDASRSGVLLQNFISALGIPLVGKSVAKAIINYYPSWEEFREAVGGDWTEFEGFGPEISRAINNFDYSAADEIATKLTFSSNASAEDAEKVTTLDGLTFVITGKLSRKRDDIKTDIENAGGKVSGSVSSKTSYLVCNDKNSTTGKSKDAKSLNVPIISEEELLKLLSGKNS